MTKMTHKESKNEPQKFHRIRLTKMRLTKKIHKIFTKTESHKNDPQKIQQLRLTKMRLKKFFTK